MEEGWRITEQHMLPTVVAVAIMGLRSNAIEVIEIIKRGNTPIVSWRSSQLKIAEYSEKSGVPYMAIYRMCLSGQHAES